MLGNNRKYEKLLKKINELKKQNECYYNDLSKQIKSLGDMISEKGSVSDVTINTDAYHNQFNIIGYYGAYFWYDPNHQYPNIIPLNEYLQINNLPVDYNPANYPAL